MHPVAILSAVFCIICSLSMLVSDALGDQMVEAYSNMGNLSMLIVLHVGCGQVYVSVVSEFVVKCES